jgi:hypothetical protein
VLIALGDRATLMSDDVRRTVKDARKRDAER